MVALVRQLLSLTRNIHYYALLKSLGHWNWKDSALVAVYRKPGDIKPRVSMLCPELRILTRFYKRKSMLSAFRQIRPSKVGPINV